MPGQDLWLGLHHADSYDSVMVGGGELDTVGVQVKIAGGVGQGELEELVFLVGLREPEEAATGST